VTPDRFITRVRRLDTRLVPYRWTWAEDNGDAIAASWERLRADTPQLFDGRMLLVSDFAHDGDLFRAGFFETGYSSFLGWRDAGYPDCGVVNGFAMGALQGSDGAYVMGVMGDHTANAGRVYFAAGTPDLSDVTSGGRVDLAASVVRELREETGLEPPPDAVNPDWIIVREGPKLAFLRPIRLAEPAGSIAERIRHHLHRDDEPELAGIRIVRGPGDIDEQAMPDFLKSFLRWSFGGGGTETR
jgi:8-oxo-dGTP pyrophosphatase MutT (NUDIX family)